MAAPPLKVVEHPKNGVAAYFLERPPGVGSTRREDSLAWQPLIVSASDRLDHLTGGDRVHDHEDGLHDSLQRCPRKVHCMTAHKLFSGHDPSPANP
jgi:hypothetical protein